MHFYHLLFAEDSPATQPETVQVVGSAVGVATLVRRLFGHERGKKYWRPPVLCRPREDGRWEVATTYARLGPIRYQRVLGTRLRDLTASALRDVPPGTNAVICRTNSFLYAQQGDRAYVRLGDLYATSDGKMARDTKGTSDTPKPSLQEKVYDRMHREPGRLIMGEICGPEAFDLLELGRDATGGLLSSIMLSESSAAAEAEEPSASPSPAPRYPSRQERRCGT